MTLLYFLFKRKNQKISKTLIMTSFNNAVRLHEDGRYEDALTIYNNLLKTVSKKRTRSLWQNQKNSRILLRGTSHFKQY